jgi:hypothetical protein
MIGLAIVARAALLCMTAVFAMAIIAMSQPD